MGTFAALFHKTGVWIPNEKREEFRTRIEKLFQMGGMMELERMQLFGKKVVTIKKASMHDDEMNFYPLPARRLPPLRWEMNCVCIPSSDT